jgi:hypothetical protein
METDTWPEASAVMHRLAASQSPEQAARTKSLAESYRNAQARVESSEEVDESDGFCL